MLTPIDIQNRTLKTKLGGYDKKDTDEFIAEVIRTYEAVYKKNKELEEKVSSLSEGIQYYKKMEDTLQKALVLAEKTSAETQEAAKSQAEAILKEANAKAEALTKQTQAKVDITLAKANRELEEARNHVRKLVQSYENYRLQFKKLASSQIEMLESEAFDIYVPEIDEICAVKEDEAEGTKTGYYVDNGFDANSDEATVEPEMKEQEAPKQQEEKAEEKEAESTGSAWETANIANAVKESMETESPVSEEKESVSEEIKEETSKKHSNLGAMITDEILPEDGIPVKSIQIPPVEEKEPEYDDGGDFMAGIVGEEAPEYIEEPEQEQVVIQKEEEPEPLKEESVQILPEEPEEQKDTIDTADTREFEPVRTTEFYEATPQVHTIDGAEAPDVTSTAYPGDAVDGEKKENDNPFTFIDLE